MVHVQVREQHVDAPGRVPPQRRTEAVDSRMDQFGEERLVRAVEKTDGQPAEASRAAILRDLAEFVGATPARDDITLVVLRVGEFAVT